MFTEQTQNKGNSQKMNTLNKKPTSTTNVSQHNTFIIVVIIMQHVLISDYNRSNMRV